MFDASLSGPAQETANLRATSKPIPAEFQNANSIRVPFGEEPAPMLSSHPQAHHQGECMNPDQLPVLHTTCPKCQGASKEPGKPRCDGCDSTGFVPTEAGIALMAFVRCHWRQIESRSENVSSVVHVPLDGSSPTTQILTP